MDLKIESMKCAVEMEVHAAMSTTTVSKGETIQKYLEAAFQAGRDSVPIKESAF